ncbi:MAG: hypothetical protein IIC33_07070, partial [Chloroflexi bacterium]|nr:hypothetical protein [Chloroflexota bacterium]
AALTNTKYDIAEKVLTPLAEKFRDYAGGTLFLNVNIPSQPADRIKGLRVTQLGGRSYGESVRVEGTGERHKGLLISAMKLASVRLSDWLPTDIRDGIDPQALLLPAALANGYVAKYGESVARRTIADGMSFARPRPSPETSSKPRLRWSGGQWVKAVRA